MSCRSLWLTLNCNFHLVTGSTCQRLRERFNFSSQWPVGIVHTVNVSMLSFSMTITVKERIDKCMHVRTQCVERKDDEKGQACGHFTNAAIFFGSL